MASRINNMALPDGDLSKGEQASRRLQPPGQDGAPQDLLLRRASAHEIGQAVEAREAHLLPPFRSQGHERSRGYDDSYGCSEVYDDDDDDDDGYDDGYSGDHGYDGPIYLSTYGHEYKYEPSSSDGDGLDEDSADEARDDAAYQAQGTMSIVSGAGTAGAAIRRRPSAAPRPESRPSASSATNRIRGGNEFDAGTTTGPISSAAATRASRKRPRRLWGNEISSKFLAAVDAVGVAAMTGRKVWEMMGVQGIKVAHVASHVSHYRQRLKTVAGLPSNALLNTANLRKIERAHQALRRTSGTAAAPEAATRTRAAAPAFAAQLPSGAPVDVTARPTVAAQVENVTRPTSADPAGAIAAATSAAAARRQGALPGPPAGMPSWLGGGSGALRPPTAIPASAGGIIGMAGLPATAAPQLLFAPPGQLHPLQLAALQQMLLLADSTPSASGVAAPRVHPNTGPLQAAAGTPTFNAARVPAAGGISPAAMGGLTGSANTARPAATGAYAPGDFQGTAGFIKAAQPLAAAAATSTVLGCNLSGFAARTLASALNASSGLYGPTAIRQRPALPPRFAPAAGHGEAALQALLLLGSGGVMAPRNGFPMAVAGVAAGGINGTIANQGGNAGRRGSSAADGCAECGRLSNEGGFWIACDACDTWVCGRCAKMTKVKAVKVEEWFCLRCRQLDPLQ